ncbi:hypothetical protein WJX74_005125 [Apatococcus lobatus]|uniref:Uncharacterized protein n=1 Tax=Apatococcus lobatus TaxID=904363 RepID=A0AAW1RLJ6_9CHLO
MFYSQVALATVDSLLLAENNITGQHPVVQYSTCSVDSVAPPGVSSTIEKSSLQRFTVASQFFGASAAKLSDFQASCSGLLLKQGRKVDIYSGPAPAGCSKTWSISPQGIKLSVIVHDTGADWSLNFQENGSLPSHPLRTTCSSVPNDEACTLHEQPRCHFVGGNSNHQASKISIASADFHCSPGQPSGPSVDGQRLVIGLTELIFNKAYNSCIPDATADYRLPDLTHRRPDSTICAADPFNVTAFGMAPDATPNLQLDSRVESPHCFAVIYTGYLVVQNNSNIQFFGPTDDSLYNKFKVCLRYNGHAGVTLGGKQIVSAVPTSFDSTFTCIETNLPTGLVPVQIEYAANPMDSFTILQMWVEPVIAVYPLHPSPNNVLIPGNRTVQYLCDTWPVLTPGFAPPLFGPHPAVNPPSPAVNGPLPGPLGPNPTPEGNCTCVCPPAAAPSSTRFLLETPQGHGRWLQSLPSSLAEPPSSSSDWQTLAESSNLRVAWNANEVDIVDAVNALLELAELYGSEEAQAYL